MTRRSDRPVYVARYGGDALAPDAMALYRDAGVRVLDTPERLVRAVEALARCGTSVKERQHA